jgi:hypothetical protein
MEAKHKRTKWIDGKWVCIEPEPVQFICITGDESAKIIDKQGKHRTVRRKTLIDVPNHILYPDMEVVGTVASDPENWKRGSYFY